MTTVQLDPSGYDLARLYAPPERPFRFNRNTAIAVSVALAFHGVVGFYVVKTHFQPKLPDYIDDGGFVVDIPRPPLKPINPPKQKIPPAPVIKAHDNPIINPLIPPLITPIRYDETPAATGPVASLDADPTPTAPANPTPIAAPDPIIRNPSWLRKPTAEQVNRLYPARAAERNVTGGATLLCEVAASGDVNSCAVVDESPKGYRFGEAAIAMSRYFRMNPRTVDGAVQAGTRVRIPIVFNLN